MPAELSFERLYELHFSFTWRVLEHLGVPRHGIDDAVQEVWIAVHRRLPGFEGRSQIETWLFGIALNVTRNVRRAEARRPFMVDAAHELAASTPDPEALRARSEVYHQVACQDVDTRELGYTDDTLDLIVSPDEPTEPFVSDVREFAGHWIGEAEESLAFGVGDGAAPAYRFPSGSSSIVIDIQLEAEPTSFTESAGTSTFGSGSAPPPPTDPDVGYPTDVDYVDLLSYFPSEDPTSILLWTKFPPHEGFAYPLGFTASEADFSSSYDTSLVLPDGILKLAFYTTEVLQPWCELQASYAHPDGNYSCIPWHDRIDVSQDGSCTLIGTAPPPGCPGDVLTLEELEALEAAGGLPEGCDDRIATPVGTADCDKVALCDNNHCTCADGYCEGGASSGASISLRLSGDTLVAEIDGATFVNARGLSVPLGTLRFRRAP